MTSQMSFQCRFAGKSTTKWAKSSNIVNFAVDFARIDNYLNNLCRYERFFWISDTLGSGQSSVSNNLRAYRWKTGVAKWETSSCIVDGMIFGKCDASWKDYASQRRVFFENEMHWDTGMHRKSNVLSRKRCIRENKCISNHAFGRKYDAYEEIYASQITCFQEKEMHIQRSTRFDPHAVVLFQ